MTRQLVVFAKRPWPGEVKTRLCPPLTPAQGAVLAEAFLRDTLLLADGLPNWQRLLAYAPRGARETMAALATRWRLRLQRGEDLGERLEETVGQLFAAGVEQVIVLGSDSPHLPAVRLREAEAALDRADLVLGPTEDGGYYLVGLSRWRAGLFEGVRWSTDHALADTLARAKALGLSCELGEMGYDVDDLGGLRRLAGELADLPPTALPHTRAVLGRLREVIR